MMANLSCNCIPSVLFPESSANVIHPSGREDGSNIRLFHKKTSQQTGALYTSITYLTLPGSVFH
ncbi:hypothetical protein, partial [Thiolapillus sp.]